jgi:Tfp pilus assembly protein PilN
MIQFNLLPDIKLEYIKSQKTKRSVLLASTITAGSALGVTVMLFIAVQVAQKGHITNLSNDIKSAEQQLRSVPDLDKVLTVQNQLKSLDALHKQKPEVSRIFEYLPKLTPNNLTISKFDIDYEKNTIEITGNADAISTVNKFADTLKFTKYTEDGNSLETEAFTNVVLDSFGLNAEEKDKKKKATFQLNMTFNEAIFNTEKKINMTVPKITSTRSDTEKPRALFEQSSTQPNTPEAN